jgi:outer membrane protein
MKQVYPILQWILLAGVVGLYILHFSNSGKKVGSKTITAVASASPASAPNGMIIAYFDMDSLNEQIPYVRDQRKLLESEQNAIANEYENAYRNMENEKNNFLKKGESITQQEAEAFQEKLMRRQQEVENSKQSRSQQLARKGAEVMEKMQKELKDFLANYNKEHHFAYIMASSSSMDIFLYKDSALDITKEIVAGMIERLSKKP